MSDLNRFRDENTYAGDIEDGLKYPFGCYKKEETYNKDEVNQMVAGTTGITTDQIDDIFESHQKIDVSNLSPITTSQIDALFEA